MTLEQVLADAREDLAVLERNGVHALPVDRVRAIVDAVQTSAEDWLTFLSESDAETRSGYRIDWLRARFAAWEREGHARTVNGRRQYRMCVIPRRANLITAAERGREAARAVRSA